MLKQGVIGAILVAGTVFGGASVSGTAAQAETRLTTVLERGKLLCSGHNGSFLGFAEVDDRGAWKGLDIELCKALAAGLFGKSEGHLDIVPISWAQRWPALQSGDIDVVIKASGWTMSRDTELNLSFSRPYFLGATQVMAHAATEAKTIADLEGGSICVSAGTSTERLLATYLDAKKIEAEVIVFEKGDEVRSAYFENRCDAMAEWGPSLAAISADAPEPEANVILSDVLAVEAEGIVLPEGDPKWMDVQNWMLNSLIFAEENGITQANVEAMRAAPPSDTIGKFLGVTPGYGSRLGLSDDWAFNMLKEVGNFQEIYDRALGESSPYKLPRGINALYTDGGVFYALIVD
jgi:general L-amino acid transport system substrate-binding protein